MPSGCGEDDENVKIKVTDRHIGDGQQAIRKAYLSFQLRWDKLKIRNASIQIDGNLCFTISFAL